MPLGDRMRRSADERLGPKVEDQVAARDGQTLHQRLDDGPSEKRRRPQVVAREAMRLQGWVSPEKLVAAVAPERDLDVPPCEFGQEVRRDDRRIPERLIEQRRQLRNEAEQHAGLERELVVIGAEVRRNLTRMSRLVERALGETDRESP